MASAGKAGALARAARLLKNRAAADGPLAPACERGGQQLGCAPLHGLRGFAAVPQSDQESDTESWAGSQAPQGRPAARQSPDGEQSRSLAQFRWRAPGAVDAESSPRLAHQRGDMGTASPSGRVQPAAAPGGSHRWLPSGGLEQLRPVQTARTQRQPPPRWQPPRQEGRWPPQQPQAQPPRQEQQPSFARPGMPGQREAQGTGDRRSDTQPHVAGTRGQPGQRAPHRQPALPPPKPKPAVTEITLAEEPSVARLAGLLELPLPQLEATLAELGEAPSSAQDAVRFATAELAAMAHGIAVNFPRSVLERDSDACPRPPVVTVMGHVDHGKTTLLDALRRTSVAASEAGGITQAIGAFQVEMPGGGGTITFLDTPGHAAFSAMRQRGAALTDVAVLVVAADDGVMPQTLEALSHARAAGCPIVVALTKCDVPGADPARARRQLLEAGLELEEAGGSVQVVETAAPAGTGLQALEEALLFQAELAELRASPSRPALGTVVEARLEKGQGAVATVIIRRGTLQVGQCVVLGSQWGKVRAMRAAGGALLQAAAPGQPVEVSGLRGMPMAGDDFMVQASEEAAQRLSKARQQRQQKGQAAAGASGAASDAESEAEGGPPQLTLLVKADCQGAAEAVVASLEALSSPAVAVKALPFGLGPVTASDIDAAGSIGARVVAFNVRAASAAVEGRAKQRGVQLLRRDVIYRLIQEVGDWMAALAPHVEQEVVLGEAAVQQTFAVRGSGAASGGGGGVVAGCRVTAGSVAAAQRFRLLRGGEAVWEGACASLKRHKQDVHRVGKGTECGVLLEGCADPQPGDVLQCITVELVPQAAEDVVTARM